MAVEGAGAPVVPDRRLRVGVAGGVLDVTRRDVGVGRGGHKGRGGTHGGEALQPCSQTPGVQLEERITAAFLVRFGPATRTEYARDLRTFAGWCGAEGIELLRLERDHIERWVRYHLEDLALAPATVSRHLATLQGFYLEGVDQEAIPRVPTFRVRGHVEPSTSAQASVLPRYPSSMARSSLRPSARRR